MTERTDSELEMLKRIVALLLSLAGWCRLAEHAPYPVRCFVLWLMRRAETVVRDWVFGPPEDDFWPMMRFGNEPKDALDMAASMEALAMAVRDLAIEYHHFLSQWPSERAVEADKRDRALDGFRLAETLRRLSSLPGFGLAASFDTS